MGKTCLGHPQDEDPQGCLRVNGGSSQLQGPHGQALAPEQVCAPPGPRLHTPMRVEEAVSCFSDFSHRGFFPAAALLLLCFFCSLPLPTGVSLRKASGAMGAAQEPTPQRGQLNPVRKGLTLSLPPAPIHQEINKELCFHSP